MVFRLLRNLDVLIRAFLVVGVCGCVVLVPYSMSGLPLPSHRPSTSHLTTSSTNNYNHSEKTNIRFPPPSTKPSIIPAQNEYPGTPYLLKNLRNGIFTITFDNVPLLLIDPCSNHINQSDNLSPMYTIPRKII